MKDDGNIVRRIGMVGLLAVAGCLLGMSLWAEDEGQSGDPTQSARAVRLSDVEGKVQVLQGNQVLADQAVANTPLYEGTEIATADDGRAEIQFEDGSVARLSPDSSLALSVLRGEGGAASDTEIALNGGLGYFELQGGQNGHLRVRFGDSVVTTNGSTVLRINLDNAPGSLAVFSGNAHLQRGQSLAVDLQGGESVALNGDDPSRYDLSESIEPDSWDAWNSDRDQELTSEAAAKTGATNSFADGNNPAWGDLDMNGDWYNVPGQGYVWSPYDAASPGWDPYGNGYWMPTPGSNYAWVSGASWGYLPYRCGIWNFYDGFGWGWAPGAGGCGGGWGGGYYGGLHIGSRPVGYRPPVRPRPRPPVGTPGQGGGRRGPLPMIAVNRPVNAGSGMFTRDRNAPVTIGGHTVEPVHPVSGRPGNDRPAPVFAGGRGPSAPVQQMRDGGRPGYISSQSLRNPEMGNPDLRNQDLRNSGAGGLGFGSSNSRVGNFGAGNTGARPGMPSNGFAGHPGMAAPSQPRPGYGNVPRMTAQPAYRPTAPPPAFHPAPPPAAGGGAPRGGGGGPRR